MTTNINLVGFTSLVAAHLSRMPTVARVVNRTDEALLCETKDGQTFMVLVTGPGAEKQVETKRVETANGKR